MYGTAKPRFDGKVFGVASYDYSTTIHPRVVTDGAMSFSTKYTFTANRTTFTSAHDWYGYPDGTLVNTPFTFATATWGNSLIPVPLDGSNWVTAPLWTDVDIAAGKPSRLSFRMFGTGDEISVDFAFFHGHLLKVMVGPKVYRKTELF